MNPYPQPVPIEEIKTFPVVVQIVPGGLRLRCPKCPRTIAWRLRYPGYAIHRTCPGCGAPWRHSPFHRESEHPKVLDYEHMTCEEMLAAGIADMRWYLLDLTDLLL